MIIINVININNVIIVVDGIGMDIVFGRNI